MSPHNQCMTTAAPPVSGAEPLLQQLHIKGNAGCLPLVHGSKAWPQVVSGGTEDLYCHAGRLYLQGQSKLSPLDPRLSTRRCAPT